MHCKKRKVKGWDTAPLIKRLACKLEDLVPPQDLREKSRCGVACLYPRAVGGAGTGGFLGLTDQPVLMNSSTVRDTCLVK